MKYIRTKTDIYELVKEDDDWVEIISNFERKMQCHCVIKKHAVIKQADTIEELCDEFVVLGVYKTNKGVPFNSLSETLNYLDEHRDWEQLTIYGAIWTEWGLKYVAKMNEKGELELL